MIKTLKNERGLTLIELIAVLVILGIIAAIAVPTIGNTINAQRERAAEAEWSAIMSSAELYLAQNSDATFSMDDLFNNDYISENVVLESDDEGTIITSSTDIFEDDGGSVAIAASVTAVYIDGFLVYSA
ncbi:MAG: prepilin-type N-terminal cleavage/methylation domain-containing protein [Bacilli bacterium]|nr:prepilin-type N-terminal cleavage/methylation domain-containing protein [Bacilli bacterium]